MGKSYKGKQFFKSGYRPVVRARVGLMLGIRQPLDGLCCDVVTRKTLKLGAGVRGQIGNFPVGRESVA